MSTKGVYVKENPHIICFIVSVVFLLASLLNLHSADLSEEYIPLTIAVGVIAGILGIVLWKRKNGKRKYVLKAERMDQLENRKIYSVIACLVFAIMAGLLGYEVYKEFNSLYVDVIIACVIGMFFCAGIFVHAHVKMQ